MTVQPVINSPDILIGSRKWQISSCLILFQLKMAEELPSKSAENFWHKERRLWIRRDLVSVNYAVDNKYTFVIHSSRFVPVLMEEADLDHSRNLFIT